MESKMFKASEIYDSSLMSTLAPIFAAFSFANIALTCMLIWVITKATPKSMKSFKLYLLQYALFSLMLELVLAICMPMMLHPFFYVYPAGISRHLHPNLSFLILLIGFCSAVAALDCVIVMTLKRYYALQAANIESRNVPFYVYCFLTTTNICVFIASQGVIFLRPMAEVFRVLPDEVPSYVALQIDDDLSDSLNLESIIIFKASALSSFPIFIVCGIIFVSIRLVLALISLILNIKSSNAIQIQVSLPLQRRNDILRWLTYIQFSGFFFLLCIPIGIICLIYFFIKQPCILVTYCIILMNTFGMYDTILTSMFVKPYRMYFLQLFPAWITKQASTRNSSIFPSRELNDTKVSQRTMSLM